LGEGQAANRRRGKELALVEAVRPSETLVNSFQSTQRYNQEDSHLYTHHRDNLKY
jgi:hypothetical protein